MQLRTVCSEEQLFPLLRFLIRGDANMDKTLGRPGGGLGFQPGGRMQRRLGNWTLSLLSMVSLVSMLTALCPCAAAELPLVVYPSFRVETDLFEGDETTPQSQHLILFDAGVVYDWPVGSGSVITVFDIPRSRVVLIHKPTRVRATIGTDLLVQMTAQLRNAAAGSESTDTLGLNAKVVPGATPESYVVEFAGNRYEATTQSVSDPAIASEFASFTAWASRLNIARHIGSPPFARIALADHLAAEQRLPRQLKLEVRRGFKTRTFRSENLVVERLSDPDRKKISDIGGMIATYSEVELRDFPSE